MSFKLSDMLSDLSHPYFISEKDSSIKINLELPTSPPSDPAESLTLARSFTTLCRSVIKEGEGLIEVEQDLNGLKKDLEDLQEGVGQARTQHFGP
jgi:hypothetical protein